MDRIFDPFFTTKGPGKGTGLGLSVCFMIVERMGGKIKATSREGEGTTITVNLPLCPDEDLNNG
jgi:two-component system NtrC family sensor kinase